MNITTLLNISKLMITNPDVLAGDKKYLFLLSHMRSYSSLLSHILGSHDNISGHSEMHLPYRRKADLMTLRYRVYMEDKEKLNGNYIFDKILHNHPISDNLLNNNNTKVLFMLRKPEDTLKSIMKMSENLKSPNRIKDINKIGNYYLNRLVHLRALAERTDGRAVYFDAEKIVNNTDFVLGFLSDWLQLPTKLSSEYKTFSNTGKPGFGDPSENIKQGKIVKNRESSNIIIPEKLLKTADEAYYKSREVIMKRCAII